MKINIGPYPENSDNHRKFEIEIHEYDTYSMDTTLATIILPMLKQLKTTQNGSPYVADADVPEHLRASNAPEKEREEDTDAFWHDRWDWVMEEMIWAFEQIVNEEAELQFSTGDTDIVYVPVDMNGNEVPEGETKLYHMVKGPNSTYHFDTEGWEEWDKRTRNGTTLFGKYFRALWD